MRLCRFEPNRFGVIEGEWIADVTELVLGSLPPLVYPATAGDPLIAALPGLLPRIREAAAKAPRKALADVRLLSPVGMPGKIIGAPANYMKHVAEVAADKAINQGVVGKTIDDLGLFLKAGTSVVGPSAGIEVHFADRRTDHEGELVAIIGKGGKDIPYEKALDHVFGYTLGLDMTLRGAEDRSLRKSVDSYAVMGPWMVTADEIADPNAVDLWLDVNGERRQESSTSYMIFNTQKLIAYASRFYTLQPGDLIMTGTPEGVAPVVPGDTIALTVPEIGTMHVQVRG
ncbi:MULTISPECIES: fumarylacetoacetate hydrolase family protein [unclassified Beijerinckia]|uniref:fumarylacetoacetate hydrolase family protein n=1 Tax=unclassified Beijerinckia TaxID=2638183 RepID=UPI0008984603|nr:MULTISPECIES: fumarylacetoacetate hydrolase family protein [unclassified Beijerinckia]MDH7797617.1 2,4-diketo-3-deoxy-L-fuconate hydrolase [Beijerinckia sp. GAS462]SEC92501.1 2-keto-4-pentenoate hydratase/2-oxohepta-3-ene-1,7-dioic acid hydratase (catechol pathway) [Beijerinckia sp. 28-YEA-48]